MAIINCPECNKEISDLAQHCPHCGYPINQKTDNNNIENNKTSNSDFNPIREKTIKNKTTKIIICVVALLIATGLLFGNHADKYEQQAIDCTETLISIMKDPSSVRLEDNVLVIYDQTDCYVYIVSSGTNSYGGRVSEMSYFVNGDFIGVSDSDDFNTTAEREAFDKAELYLSAWNFFGSDCPDFESAKLVDKKKVAKKLHIDYLQ